MVDNGWTQNTNVVVVDSTTGEEIAGLDFTAVQDSLIGNTAFVTGNFTESGMVAFSDDDISFAIKSNTPDIRIISAGAEMITGKGAFFSLTTYNTLTLNLSNVQFIGGKGASDQGNDFVGGVIYSAGDIMLTGNAIFGGTEVGKENTADYGGVLGAYDSISAVSNIVINGNFKFLKNSATVGGAIYTGNDVSLSDTNIALATKSDTGIKVNILTAPTGNVHRYNSNNTWQNSDNTFDRAFLEGAGASVLGDNGVLTGDKIILTGNANSTAVTNLTDVTALSIYSNVAGTQRTITNTNTTEGSGGFLVFDGENDVTLTLSDVKFTDGTGYRQANIDYGGAIFRKGNMTFNGNAVFENNTAGYGGALGTRLNTTDTITLNGHFQFLDNKATYGGAVSTANFTTFGMNAFIRNSATYGGAISSISQATFIGDNTFIDNLAGTGGAIYNQGNVTFSGSGSQATFSGNKHGVIFDADGNPNANSGTPNDIYTSGRVTIEDSGTYSFGGGIVATGYVYVSEAQVSFGSDSVSNVSGLDVSNGANVALESGSQFTVDETLNVVGKNSTLALGNNIQSLSMGGLNVSDNGSLVLDLGKGTFTPFEVNGGVTFDDTSTLMLEFDETFSLSGDMPVLLFTLDGRYLNEAELTWNQPTSGDISVELIVEVLQESNFHRISAIITGNSIGNPVPEPATWGMLLLGLATWTLYARRKKRA